MDKSASREEEEHLLLKGNADFVTQDWSPDGRFLLYGAIDRNTRKGDLWMRPAVSDGAQPQLVPFFRTPFDENFARFSPNGKWVTYQSDESGRYEVYVRPANADGTAGEGKWQVSTNGGIEARWSSRSNELFYIGPDNMMMAVDVNPGTTFQPGVPRPLFPTRPAGVLRYDVTPDGQRFLVSVPTQDAGAAPATIVLNWFQVLNGSAPVQ